MSSWLSLLACMPWKGAYHRPGAWAALKAFVRHSGRMQHPCLQEGGVAKTEHMLHALMYSQLLGGPHISAGTRM